MRKIYFITLLFIFASIHNIYATEQVNAAKNKYLIKEIEIIGESKDFSWIKNKIKKHENTYMNENEINELVNELNRQNISRGYLTTHIEIPEQNIMQGKLKLELKKGLVNEIKYAKGSEKYYWKNAIPLRNGEPLNIRLLEYGTANMQAKTSYRLKPSGEGSTTDIELEFEKIKPLNMHVSVSTKQKGKTDITGGIEIQNPLNINDKLSLEYTQNFEKEENEADNELKEFAYTVPQGKGKYSIKIKNSNYEQKIPKTQKIVINSGKTKETLLKYEYLLEKTDKETLTFDINLGKKESHTYVNKTEIPIQKRNTTTIEAGLTKNINTEKEQLKTRIAYKKGIGILGAQKETKGKNSPKTRYEMLILDIDYKKPIQIFNRKGIFNSNFHLQHTLDGKRLYTTDMMSIGDLRSTKGFDGEYTLSSESGWKLETTWTIPIGNNNQIYIGSDISTLYGPNTEYLIGKTLWGFFIGTKGNIGNNITYDIFTGMPLYKPDKYLTKNFVIAFVINFNI